MESLGSAVDNFQILSPLLIYCYNFNMFIKPCYVIVWSEERNSKVQKFKNCKNG